MRLPFRRRPEPEPENPDVAGPDQADWSYWAMQTHHGLVWRCCRRPFVEDHAFWCHQEILGPCSEWDWRKK